ASSSAYVFEMCPRSTYVIVWLMTSGHRVLCPFRGSDQKQARVFQKPPRCCRASAAIAALVRCWTLVWTMEQVFIVECGSRTQLVGSTRWPGGSSTTITVRAERRIVAVPVEPARIARDGAQVPAQLPTMSVTSGRSWPARFVAQRYHARHSPRASTQVRGMQLTLTNGTTTQLSRWAMSRIVVIHICACESPMTAISFAL